MTAFSLEAMLFLYVCLLLGLLFSFAIMRRSYQTWKLRRLKHKETFYKARLETALKSGKALEKMKYFSSFFRFIKWQAVERALLDLINNEAYKSTVREMFLRLGYVDFYEARLANATSAIIKASAIDRLGKMLSAKSIYKLMYMLNSKNPEIIAVTVRALSRIGSVKGLQAIMKRLPDLFENGLVSQKTIQTAFVNFGTEMVPFLLEHAGKITHPKFIESLLESFYYLPPSKTTISFAMDHLASPHAEVRAKAARVLWHVDSAPLISNQEVLLPLLEDPVWFVRLNAAKVVGTLGSEKAISMLGNLLYDDSWHVRNTAAMALAQIGEPSIDTFLKVLRSSDQYTKESISEEIERTYFTSTLIGNLASEDRKLRENSREILRIMHSLHFSTPLFEHLRGEKNATIREEIESLLQQEAVT